MSPSQFGDDIQTVNRQLQAEQGEKPSRFTVYPDKYGIKYSETPSLGKYDVEKADKIVRAKVYEHKITQPLNLYRKEKSVNPEIYENVYKPFGASVHGKIDMGSKYKNDYRKEGVTPRDIDYDKMYKCVQKKMPSVSFGYQRKVKRDDLGSSFCSIPDKGALEAMTREEKIALINRINGGG